MSVAQLGSFIGIDWITMTQPAPRADTDDEIDEVVVPVEHVSLSDAEFKVQLAQVIPHLRAFGRSLSGSRDLADDLVQETLLKAWKNQDRFEPGSNLQAWLCTILRNQFYTDIRKRKREVEDADGTMAGQMVASAAQEANSELQQVKQHLAKLPAAMREALLHVGAQGLTYEDAAELIGCQVGTVKSRVSRARALLARSLGMDTRSTAL